MRADLLERRNEIRATPQRPLLARLCVGTSELLGVVRDVSFGGVGIWCDPAPAVGEDGALALRFAGGDDLVSAVPVDVVRVEATAGTPALVACAFAAVVDPNAALAGLV